MVSIICFKMSSFLKLATFHSADVCKNEITNWRSVINKNVLKMGLDHSAKAQSAVLTRQDGAWPIAFTRMRDQLVFKVHVKQMIVHRVHKK